jgi:hypothetical protein
MHVRNVMIKSQLVCLSTSDLSVLLYSFELSTIEISRVIYHISHTSQACWIYLACTPTSHRHQFWYPAIKILAFPEGILCATFVAQEPKEKLKCTRHRQKKLILAPKSGSNCALQQDRFANELQSVEKTLYAR